jgi:5-(carboxyamino)imidazole ribonucleotide synthase
VERGHEAGRNPGKLRTVAVLGGGQLGRMLAMAGVPLNIRCRFLDPSSDASAAAVGEHLCAPWDGPGAIEDLVAGAEVATFEFENVSLLTARAVHAMVELRPGPQSLEAKQDRLTEKRFLNDLGIETARFAPINDRSGLDLAVAEMGLPAVLKIRRDGYDGKGQCVLRSSGDVEQAWKALAGKPLILEGFVSFDREVSLLAVRALDGEVRCWPLVENEHRDGILYRSIAPALHAEQLQRQAEAAARTIMAKLDHVGVLAIEFFVVGDHLLVNEMAPRVHNTGHWTIEGSVTSQFANHLRAICGLPLGETAMRGHAAMLNLIGSIPDPIHLLAIPGAYLHLYGKEPRPGRKVGHVTVCAESRPRLLELVRAVEQVLASG